MLTIRSAQLEALQAARLRAGAADVAENVRARFPRLLAGSERPVEDHVADALAWGRPRGAGDKGSLVTLSAVFAAFGPPPWRAPFASPLRDIHLSPEEQVRAFLAGARSTLDAQEQGGP